MNILAFIKQQLSISERPAEAVLKLLDEGATVPFIARYRKERTGGMDEVQITAIRDTAKKYRELEQRRQTILQAIEEQGKLTDDLRESILHTFDSATLEDLYLPFRQKRQTRGEKAKKAGLEPLAKMIMSQRGGDPFQIAERFVKNDIENEEAAIQGAKDIIAEWINENSSLRGRLRNIFRKKAVLRSKLVKGKAEEGQKYANYFEFEEPLHRSSSHRFLAISRAAREGILNVHALPTEEDALEQIERFFVKGNDACSKLVSEACRESYKRLLAPSLENEVMNEVREKADEEAINIFSVNLRQLLLAPPLGSKRILAVDPGFRTGCKVVCLDENGDLLTNTTIYPHPPQNERSAAQAKISQLVEAYKIEAIAIGDGTAGRETENLVRHIRFNRDVEVFVVREDGASVYSASSVARKEFPDHDVTVRGSVSIGRRLMDPLSELVKIDPKSIGVGQYQHDVDQARLKSALEDVIVSSVNSVGVDLNTASPYLLGYVSGLGPALAENIVAFRTENGGFKNRAELKKVKRLGDKAFEQAAGFLRVRNSENPLDNSAVHPESYAAVDKMARKIGKTTKELIGDEATIAQLKAGDFPEIDPYTFKDLIRELRKPGRDPRKKAEVLEFDHRLKTITDLIPGMKVTGIVTNVTAFGAFVNIGIKENGLIHKSQLADVFVDDPARFIALHEHVEVEVLEVDVARKRIALKRVN